MTTSGVVNMALNPVWLSTYTAFSTEVRSSAPFKNTLIVAVPVQSAFTCTVPVSGESKFYCNIGELNPAERAHHKQLTEKLIAVRQEIVELPRGYEFQFSPSSTSIAELADWVVAEEKCCPFFNFHIDLEKSGDLLCLGLTGEEGIRSVVRTEFRVPVK
jgi:hypothetical protein